MVLGALDHGQPMTTQELSAQTGLAAATVRVAGTSLTHDGWITATEKIPTYWKITDFGLRLIATRPYREYRTANA